MLAVGRVQRIDPKEMQGLDAAAAAAAASTPELSFGEPAGGWSKLAADTGPGQMVQHDRQRCSHSQLVLTNAKSTML